MKSIEITKRPTITHILVRKKPTTIDYHPRKSLNKLNDPLILIKYWFKTTHYQEQKVHNNQL